MDEQTEWMDERPDDSPQSLPAPTIQELWKQIVDAYKPITQAFVSIGTSLHNAFQGQEFYGTWTDEAFDDKGPETDREAMLRVMRQKQNKNNHGPRSGDKYDLRGRRKW